MDREQLANEIELFCNDAPDNTYLARHTVYDSQAGIDVDTFVYVRNLRGVSSGGIPEILDPYIYKDCNGVIYGLGRFSRYIDKGNTFNKAFYLDPDDLKLAK